MTDAAVGPTLTLEHAALSEAEALSLTKAIPEGLACTWEIADDLNTRLHTP